MAGHNGKMDALLRCLDDFMAAFNARGVDAFETTFSFPASASPPIPAATALGAGLSDD